MFRSIGPAELLIILAIVVVLFGASRIGDIGGALGKGIREFRRELREGQEDEEKENEKDKEAAAAETGDDKTS